MAQEITTYDEVSTIDKNTKLLLTKDGGLGQKSIEEVGNVINGTGDISGIGDGTVKGAIRGLNDEIFMQMSDGFIGKNMLDVDTLFKTLSDNADNTTHSFLDGVLKISRINNYNSGVYVYNKSLNIFKGKALTLSFDAKSSADGMKLRFFICDGTEVYSDKISTNDYTRHTININAGSGGNNNFIIYGNAVAGDVYLKNIMITPSSIKDNTYTKFIPSNAVLYDNYLSILKRIEILESK